jgi:hypothetical protein
LRLRQVAGLGAPLLLPEKRRDTEAEKTEQSAAACHNDQKHKDGWWQCGRAFPSGFPLLVPVGLGC